MIKANGLLKYALIATLGFSALCSLGREKHKQENIVRESVVVSNVVDGDTLDLADGRRIRFADVNSPDKENPCYKESLCYLQTLKGKKIGVEIIGKDMYSRPLARVYDSTNYVNLDAVRKGYACKFFVSREEIKEFASAERDAIEKQRGIWKKSPYFGKIIASVNAKNETVSLRNSSTNSISLEGFVLKDESREQFVFSSAKIGACKVLSGKSDAKLGFNEFFWVKKDIWNDNRDTLYLFDRLGRLAAYYCYGYE